METTSPRVTVAYLMQRARLPVRRAASHTYVTVDVPQSVFHDLGKVRRCLPSGVVIDRYNFLYGYIVFRVPNSQIPVVDLSSLSRWD